MGYTNDEQMVRVDFFQEQGKWYTTESVRWVTYSGMLIYDAFAQSLRENDHIKNHYFGMWAVCLEPYHEHEHPLMMKWNG